MVKRVAIFGTESTGKSSLAAALAAHFDEPCAAEYVREFWDRRGGEIAAWDLATIARGQIANEETAVLAARRVVFCDTDLLTNVLWADVLYDGKISDWVREAAEARSRQYAMYLFCEPDLPWEQDPQRVFADAEAWRQSAERCRAVLMDRGLPCVSIRGTGDARLSQAIAVVEKVLNSNGS
ncbi:AAA family ATPase [Synoicihabitans lomoniglobus]|uniref:AAA family ATPase n=1 Tax=Synoicihabitans lomoniglobus TaxID=2909285 RepID=A0AAF0CIM8_9BACT|nr:AAA family ATPase [Opitutaceae bacterium LMO-M01]WED65582.1 AAA family ATPase [Opitutaceae bacterium LMO-M01]